jgi:hypothetical protein
MSPASLQTFIDTPNCVLEDRVQYSTVRVQYSTVHIPNVICDVHLQIINCVSIEKPQTPFRENHVMFMFVPVR